MIPSWRHAATIPLGVQPLSSQLDRSISRTLTSLWLALAAGALGTGCATDVPTPTDPALSANRGRDTKVADGRDHGRDGHGRRTATMAVIGDVPYGDPARASFPSLIGAINLDPEVQVVVHVGDIKSGSTQCTNDWFRAIYDDFQTFADPLVYAIGDNEWTDCHRANNGGYNPLDRLAAVREIFFSQPGWTLGAHPTRTRAERRYPENQRWKDADVVFASLHIIGSNNGLDPWFGDRVPPGETPEETASRIAEVTARNRANLEWLARTFEEAREEHAAGVVLFFQADLWHPEDRAAGADFSEHTAFVQQLAKLASRFRGQVLLVSGDSHDLRVDPGVPWFSFYGAEPQPNVTQLIVDRSIEADIDWVKLTVDPTSPTVFSWEQRFVP